MSNNLDIDQVAAAQNQKEITINDANGQLDAALTDSITISVDSSNAYTLSNTELRRYQFITIDEDGGDPADADITVTVPAVSRGVFYVLNDTAFNVTIEISGQSESSPILPSGSRVILTVDGSDVRQSSEGVYLENVVEDTTPQLGGNLDLNSNTITGFTASRALETDGSGNLQVSAVTSIELNYLDGVTSAIQTQLDAKLENVVEDTTPQLGGNLDLNSNIIVGAGTEAAPAYSVSAGNGMFLAGTDMIGFSTSGTEKVRINNSGEVLIGSDTDVGTYKLQVTGGAAVDKPSNYWSTVNSHYLVGQSSTGQLGQLDTHGGFEVTLTANGYRNNSTQWTSYEANSEVGAAQIALNPDGTIYFRTDATKTTGSSTAISNRLAIESDGTLNVSGTTDYENLVTSDDDVPNKKYVDDEIAASDERVKQNIQPLTLGTDFIKSLEPVSFSFITGDTGRTHLGFKAQQVRDEAVNQFGDTGLFASKTHEIRNPSQEVVDAIVAAGGEYTPSENVYEDIRDPETGDPTGEQLLVGTTDSNVSIELLGLRYIELIAPLVKSVQELTARVEQLEV